MQSIRTVCISHTFNFVVIAHPFKLSASSSAISNSGPNAPVISPKNSQYCFPNYVLYQKYLTELNIL